MKLKLLRKWFAQSLAKPIRLSAQHFAELLETLFQESTTEADVTKFIIRKTTRTIFQNETVRFSSDCQNEMVRFELKFNSIETVFDYRFNAIKF